MVDIRLSIVKTIDCQEDRFGSSLVAFIDSIQGGLVCEKNNLVTKGRTRGEYTQRARIILGIDSPATVRVAETGVELVRVSDPSSTPAVSAEPSLRQSNPPWSIYEPLPQNPCSRPPLPQTGGFRCAPTTRKATQAASHCGTPAE
jgi:hypothetical protein